MSTKCDLYSLFRIYIKLIKVCKKKWKELKETNARKKKIEEIKSSDLATDTQTNQEILDVTIPPSRKAGIKVKSVKELLDKLKDQEGIKL